MNQQQITQAILNCSSYNMNLGKDTFNPANLQALPREYTIYSYTDTSIIWSYNDCKYYTCREDLGWATERM